MMDEMGCFIWRKHLVVFLLFMQLLLLLHTDFSFRGYECRYVCRRVSAIQFLAVMCSYFLVTLSLRLV